MLPYTALHTKQFQGQWRVKYSVSLFDSDRVSAFWLNIEEYEMKGQLLKADYRLTGVTWLFYKGQNW